MKVLLQRVKSANVSIEGKIKSEIGKGLLLFVGVGKHSTEDMISKLVRKILNLRIFENDLGKLDQSVTDLSLEILIISQFTLYNSLKKGNRPDFSPSANYEKGKEFYNLFIEEIKKSDLIIQTGEFGADMKVELINDGPLTIMLDSSEF